MGYSKTPQNRRVSPRLKSKMSSNDGDFSSNNLFLNTSESSVSTCDSFQLKRSLPQSNTRFNKKINSSINNDDYLNSDTDSDYKPVSKSEKICKRCDQLTCQLTEMRIQNFDRWLSEIKTLEDMLFKKESIIEDLKRDVSEREEEIALLKKEETSLKKNNTKLQNQMDSLKTQMASKDIHISELEYSIKEKNDLVIEHKKKIEKLEKLAQEDSKLIKKLRSGSLSN